MKYFLLLFITLINVYSQEKIIINDFRVNDDLGNALQGYSSISSNSQTNFVIVWRDSRNNDNRDIYFQRYNSMGYPLGGNTKVNDTPGVDYISSVKMSESDNLIIVWASNQNGVKNVYLQRLDSNAVPIGSNILVNDDVGGTSKCRPRIDMDGDGNFIVVWEDWRNGNADIYFQCFSSEGQKLNDNIKVNDDVGVSKQINPDIIVYENGSFVITWTDESNFNIYFQRYNYNGIKVGINTIVNDNMTPIYRGKSKISTSEGNAFLIVWEDLREGHFDVYYQRYDSSGIALGLNSKVDSSTSKKIYPAIASNETGNTIIVWEDFRSNNLYPEIYGRKYSAEMIPMGVSYKIVKNESNNDNLKPEISVDHNNIIACWMDNRLDENYDIFAKVVDWSWNGITSISDDRGKTLSNFSLTQNYPNPFNPSTKISWQAPITGHQTIKVFDVLGREVTTLIDEYRNAGSYEVEFNANNLPSGVYFYQLKAGDYLETKKMILLK